MTSRGTRPRRIGIITSAHPVSDKRVFQRHALFLRQAGFEVHLIAPHDRKEGQVNGVFIHGVPRRPGYRGRLLSLRAIARAAADVSADLYHFHDPDLLPVGLLLRRRMQVPVVYDVHEDLPLAARTSRGFHPVIGWGVGALVAPVETLLARRTDAVVCAHRPRLQELLARGQEGLFLPNYPPSLVFGIPMASVPRERSAIYTGLLSEARGSSVLLAAAARSPDINYRLFAEFPLRGDYERFAGELLARGLTNVQLNGFVPFEEIPRHLATAGVGIMPWAATPQHLRGAQPSKLYEYLAARLPVVASDLPITREVIEGNGAGVLHAPSDPDDLVARLREVLDEPARAAEMGERGRAAFERKYNYEAAGQALIEMYERLWSRRLGRR